MPGLAPWPARSVKTAFSPAFRLVRSSLTSTPDSGALKEMFIGPGAPFITVNCSDWPSFRVTDCLSIFTCENRKSAELGMAGKAGAAPPGEVLPGVILPNGESRNDSGSTYQYHLPST